MVWTVFRECQFREISIPAHTAGRPLPQDSRMIRLAPGYSRCGRCRGLFSILPSLSFDIHSIYPIYHTR